MYCFLCKQLSPRPERSNHWPILKTSFLYLAREAKAEGVMIKNAEKLEQFQLAMIDSSAKYYGIPDLKASLESLKQRNLKFGTAIPHDIFKNLYKWVLKVFEMKVYISFFVHISSIFQYC